jgi:lipoate-protein ligase A
MPSALPIWDFSAREPAENLAADEALLDWCEAGEDREALRFWESPVHFIVLGYGNRIAEEVRLEDCRAAGVPVLRRCSGGGSVVQGPGCLNYSVVLEIARAPKLAGITDANRFVMERNRAAIEQLLGHPVSVEGFTDLATDGRKFSGNAQRRKRRCLLFHGTVLLGLDLARVAQWLLPPPRQPDYRRARPHGEFIANLPLTAVGVKTALARAWRADGSFGEDLSKAIARLVAERYGRDDWNLRI